MFRSTDSNFQVADGSSYLFFTEKQTLLSNKHIRSSKVPGDPPHQSNGSRPKRIRIRPSNPAAVKKSREKKKIILSDMTCSITNARKEASILQHEILALNHKAIFDRFEKKEIPKELESKKYSKRPSMKKYDNDVARHHAKKETNRTTSWKQRNRVKIEEENIRKEIFFWQKEIPYLRKRLHDLQTIITTTIVEKLKQPRRGRKQQFPRKRIIIS